MTNSLLLKLKIIHQNCSITLFITVTPFIPFTSGAAALDLCSSFLMKGSGLNELLLISFSAKAATNNACMMSKTEQSVCAAAETQLRSSTTISESTPSRANGDAGNYGKCASSIEIRRILAYARSDKPETITHGIYIWVIT
jgi:hypothetical protein